MADYRLKGPTDSWEQSLRTDNGCLARQPAAARGPTDGAVAGHASEWDPATLLRRAGAVTDAWQIGRARAPAAIVRATGLDDLPKLADSVISGMLQLVAMVAASTALGATAGAALGALFAGVGAVPGAAAGAELGFDAGIAVLTWLGLGAMAIEIARGLGEVSALAHRAVVTAWDAEDKPSRRAEIDAAGQCLADAIGKLMLLLLIAIVARLTAAQAAASTEAAAGSASELIATLRRSRLGEGFAAWVEANAGRLMRNPKLRMHSETAGAGSAQSSAVTPSKLKGRGARSSQTVSEEPPPKPARKARQPTRRNKNIDHDKTIEHADGSKTYVDRQGRSVRYSKDGYPDFGPYAEAEVELDGLEGTFPPDDELANQAIGLDSTPDGYTWHHVEDGKTMQLVPTDLHKNFPHTGGASVLRSNH